MPARKKVRSRRRDAAPAAAAGATPQPSAEQIQRAIYRISEAAHTAPSLHELFAAIHGIVAELMNARNFYIALHDAASDTLSFPYFVDEYDPTPAPKRPGKGLTEYVLRTGEAALVTPDVHEALERRGEVELIGAPSIDWLGVPLKTAGKTIGVLVVQTYAEGVRYGTTERDVLLFVSTQVAMAIERKRAEEALRDSEERYRRLVELAPDAIAVHSEGALVFANAAAARLFGAADPAELVGRPVMSFVHPDFQSIVAERLRSMREGGQQAPLITEKFVRLDGSTVDVEVQAVPIRFQGRPAVQVVVRDVTEKQVLEGQLRQAQKMEAVGRLAGGVAHDFNNLLTAVLSSTDFLLETLGFDHPGREDAEEIRKAALRAADLTRQLLAFGRRQILKPKVLDLNAVVADMEKLLRRLIGEDVALGTRLAPSLGPVRADPGQLEQVIVNLAVNARDAMPQGGTLTIETADVGADEVRVPERVSVAPGGYVMLAMSDTGTGIDPETQARLFEPFFTTKPQGTGTGLGLATVYGIVKQSAGYIWVESAQGRGTTFRVYLPRAEKAAAPVRPHAPVRESPRGTETILLVEDDRAVREMLRRALADHGYRVLEAANGAEALARSAADDGRIHLLLTDVVMPGMGGRELTERLGALRPEMAQLLISGYTDDDVIRHGVVEAAIPFMQKPFTPGELLVKVREVLDRSR